MYLFRWGALKISGTLRVSRFVSTPFRDLVSNGASHLAACWPMDIRFDGDLDARCSVSRSRVSDLPLRLCVGRKSWVCACKRVRLQQIILSPQKSFVLTKEFRLERVLPPRKNFASTKEHCMDVQLCHNSV